MNLYKETEAKLRENGKSIADIIAVQGNDFGITVEDFIELAKNTDYDDGYGGQEVASDLLVIGKNWWLERAEYDGSEWWEFKKFPKIKKNIQTIRALTGWSSEDLKGINTWGVENETEY